MMNDGKVSRADFRNLSFLFGSVLLLLIVCIGIVLGMVLYTRDHARDIAQVHLSDVTWEMKQGAKTAGTLSQVASEADGNLPHFELWAAQMQELNPVIRQIRLSIDGKATRAYPETPLNEFSLRNTYVPPALESGQNEAVMVGPFSLPDKDFGTSFYHPVYSRDNHKLIGYSVIEISVEPLLREEEFGRLDEEGYFYVLTQKGPGDEAETVITSNTDQPLSYPLILVDECFGHQFVLKAVPKDGWVTTPFYVLMAFILLLAGCLIHMVLRWRKLHGQAEKLKEEARQLMEESIQDPLTGLFNRRGFDEEAEKFLKRGNPAVLAFLDINDFKIYNDVYGHEAGDAALLEVAKEISSLAKTYGGLTGRMGGDEFILLLSGTCEEIGAKLSAWAEGKHSISYEGKEIEFSVSVGYAASPDMGNTLKDLVVKADQAVYQAKKVRSGKACCYREDMQESARAQLGFNVKDFSYGLPGAFFICEANKEGKVPFANQEMALLYGYSEPCYFVGQKAVDLIDSRDRESLKKELIKNMKGNYDRARKEEISLSADRIDFHIIARDGSRKKVMSFGKMTVHNQYGPVMYVMMVEI